LYRYTWGGTADVRLTVKGVTSTGYLLAVDGRGARYELHPDGNSLDFFKGLVRKKLP
jgi:biotin--protein ligase